jgi:hypothetical protein
LCGNGDTDGDEEEAECCCDDKAAPALADAAAVSRDDAEPELEPELGADAAAGDRERRDEDKAADRGATSKSPLNARRKRAISERRSSFSLQRRIRFDCDETNKSKSLRIYSKRFVCAIDNKKGARPNRTV